MAMRPGRLTRRPVIGHPVVRSTVRDDAASVIAGAVHRRGPGVYEPASPGLPTDAARESTSGGDLER
ncbi:peptidase associated/transthyretin-like domain-containing protein [Williamsia muralis]|uniref:Uncharacterized protein n=1 Tax=Williamsia marianensis TaxID=85044 RepID=A0ABU4EVL5_WILMA|nr:hypothetical protein [Williamsia muralis]MDV7135298.1 hypothetical protein [Williamsia muralis]